MDEDNRSDAPSLRETFEAQAVTVALMRDQFKLGIYPVAIIEDRYGGAYSGGLWLAVAGADLLHEDQLRASFVLSNGPHGDDASAMLFWDAPPEWIATGSNPDAAIMALMAKARASESARKDGAPNKDSQ